MPQLIVRNIDARVVKALKQRAAKHGRSAEAEHRQLLEEALLGASRPSFKDFLRTLPAAAVKRDRSGQRKLAP